MLITLSEGRPEGVEALLRMDSIDFYFYLAAWEARQKAIAAAYEKHG